MSESSCVLFPWLGTRSFRTLRRFLNFHATELGISGVASEGCYYITFKVKPSMRDTLEARLLALLQDGFETEDLVGGGELPVFDKYDDFVPPELLRRAYAADRLDAVGVMRDFAEKEFEDA